MIDTFAPPGYESFLVGRAQVVAQAALAGDVRAAMAGATLHEWAARQPGAQAMQGRATAWATRFSGGTEVVVRHSRHGGLLAPITGDLFLAPTRAPRELAAALRLAAAGVPTPKVLAYALYPAMGPFARADVATALLRGIALPEAWPVTLTVDESWLLVEAIATLLAALRQAGAHHPDLNVRNVLILDRPDAPAAAVLDVDRVVFGAPGDSGLAAQNLRRLLRSMAKAHVGFRRNLTSRQVQRLRDVTGGSW
ncbi:MAG: lipopolysaccharide kinase InaA family protein [Gemmatimonadales bacterium]